jgi:hypothetical protein
MLNSIILLRIKIYICLEIWKNMINYLKSYIHIIRCIFYLIKRSKNPFHNFQF